MADCVALNLDEKKRSIPRASEDKPKHQDWLSMLHESQEGREHQPSGNGKERKVIVELDLTPCTSVNYWETLRVTTVSVGQYGK